LIAALRRRCPDLQASGMGGPAMAAAGVDLVADSGGTAVVGLTELWEKRRALHAALRTLRAHLAEVRPAVLICVDFPDFNLLLARTAGRLGIPVCYFISPQIWAWRRGRIRTIRRLVKKMLVLFPFEETLYRAAGVDVSFVGHPLLDVLADVPSREVCRRELGIASHEECVGLLPGSRQAEVRRHLPVLLDGARRILAARPTAVIVVGLADSTDPTTVEGIIQASGLSVRIVRGRTPVMMRAADLLLAVSGTVTLEAAILGTPMLIVYRLGFLSWLLARLLVRVRFIGLPNLVADASVVPELIQFAATPERIAATAQEMLGQPGRLERMRQDLAAVRQRLGEAGAADRAAVEVLRLLGRDGGGRAV
jgi:lipid-A-disaccharide synthase